jgi:hypothetical protein
LEALDVVQVFVFAGFAELIRQFWAFLRRGGPWLHLGPAFFALEAAAGALNHPPHSDGLLPAPQDRFFLAGKLDLVVEGNDFSHVASPESQNQPDAPLVQPSDI